MLLGFCLFIQKIFIVKCFSSHYNRVNGIYIHNIHAVTCNKYDRKWEPYVNLYFLSPYNNGSQYKSSYSTHHNHNHTDDIRLNVNTASKKQVAYCIFTIYIV